IVTVLGTTTDPKLPKGTMDWILLVDVYHEFQEPKPMLAKIREALKPDGRVALVEYRAEDHTADHISPPHRMSVEQILREWQPRRLRGARGERAAGRAASGGAKGARPPFLRAPPFHVRPPFSSPLGGREEPPKKRAATATLTNRWSPADSIDLYNIRGWGNN